MIDFIGFSQSPRNPDFAIFLLEEKILDVFTSFCHTPHMAKNIVRVSGGKSSFRIVVPHKIIKEMAWEDVEYVVVKKTGPDFLTIRRLFDDETSKRSG